MLRLRNVAAICSLCLVLVACNSAEERAEDYYESALELIEAGDVDRAIVELRNVFELVPNHAQARLTMARLMLDIDNKSGAYAQYLRLVEQEPDHVEALTVLSEIAFEARNWPEFERHAKRAVELSPEAPSSQIFKLAMEYRAAVEAEDGPARDALVTQAEALMAEQPENPLLPNILFDSYVRNNDYERAITQLDLMIANTANTRPLYTQKLQLLGALQDHERITSHLREMIALFPDDLEPKSQLVQYLISRGELDEAETFLREISDPTAEEPNLFIDLVRFVGETRGIEAAQEELRNAIEVAPNPGRFKMMLALLDFEAGNREKAITDLQAAMDQAEPGDLKNTMKISMARMLITDGNEVGGRRLVDEILEADGSHVDALKMQAVWLIQSDDTDTAIANLRRALDTAPEDVQAMTLMADAYTRAGSRDLARDFMALAVDTSNQAPAPSLRYAQALISEQRFLPAEDVLLAALRGAPNNFDIIASLGEVYMRMEDYNRVESVVERLGQLDTEEARRTANMLRAEILGRREGTEKALSFLQGIAEQENSDINAELTLLRAQLNTGQTGEALDLATRMANQNPDNAGLQYLLASVTATTGDLDRALAILQTQVAQSPEWVRSYLLIYRILRIQGNVEGALQAIDDGLNAVPGAPDLLWAKASEMEAAGEIDQAIAVYEGLYETNPNSTVIANNLASMITTYRDGAEDLDRAWNIARRLRGTTVPAFQDTYGWIAFRRGNTEEALEYLEQAATGLPRDAVVQFHLGQVYAALERMEDALAQYRKVVEIADDTDTRTQITTARAEIARLEATTGTQDN